MTLYESLGMEGQKAYMRWMSMKKNKQVHPSRVWKYIAERIVKEYKRNKRV